MALHEREVTLVQAIDSSAIGIPALIPFPPQKSLLFKITGGDKSPAIAVMRSVALQMLAYVPPGKVEFTFIDPVGLGENFALFMELKNYDDALVGHRVWTDQRQIEQRLAGLSEKIEDIIQTYLRSEFETIDQYNAKAGEVAEPYRILLVADFPVNFTEEAARRLLSIATNGPRCGVYALIAWDTSQPIPHGFPDLASLQSGCTLIRSFGPFLRMSEPNCESFVLRPNMPPEPSTASRILREVGLQSKDAKRVQVPFEFIEPKEPRWPRSWETNDTISAISVPIGKRGARDLQLLQLGENTALHALICGRTGSGKTTLFHALILNLSLTYSADELELYLVDFKEGVEFKRYAEFELPHARVVAIESEREFGLSVLQGLYKEFGRRGELFRQESVPDIREYRYKKPMEQCPRILLIVDEFQEFFVADDKISQEAALLLDSLVRKGRAFGIHVILGTQTLAGAYSLAKSTIDQMGVRIALQSSDADARLIMSDDNSAARLLKRPGEAIYNDANGLVEGNHPFQVAWIDKEECAERLQAIRKTTRRRRPQIVFDGTSPALPEKNNQLRELLNAPGWPTLARAAYAWVGEPVSIKDDATAAVFRRQSGSNLVIVGQNETAALDMIATATISLAAQHHGSVNGSPAKAFFVALDFTPVDAPHKGKIDTLFAGLPHRASVAPRRQFDSVLAEIAHDVDQRLSSDEMASGAPSLYLIVFGLQRARDLREDYEDHEPPRQYDDDEEREAPPPHPSKSFARILRDGPEVGIHSIVWCDNMNNLDRAIGSRGIHQFATRLALQMGEQDSSKLLDTPDAGKLGPHRAYLFAEEEGTLEKFRPYAWTDSWWQFVVDQFRKKTQIHGTN